MDVGKLPNHLKYVGCICLFWINYCSVLSFKQSPMDWDSSWPRFYLRFYNCYILCSNNWHRLWGTALQASVLWCLSSSESSKIQPRATNDIFAHYGRPNKEKRKGLKNSFQKNLPSSQIRYVKQPFNISDIFITISTGQTKERKIRATPYFLVSFVHSSGSTRAERKETHQSTCSAPRLHQTSPRLRY